MRPSLVSGLALLSAVSFAAPAAAQDWRTFIEAERAPLLRAAKLAALTPTGAPKAPRPPDVPATLDVVHRTMDVDVDPTTGVVDASIEVRFRAVGSPLAQLGFAYSAGLTASAATLNGAAATLTAGTSDGGAYVYVQFPVAVAPDAEGTVTLHYAGTVACNAASNCSMSPGFSHFSMATIFPYIFEANGNNLAFDGATTDLTLRTPPGLDAVVSAEQQGEARTENGRSVTTWKVPKPVQHGYGFYAFLGNLSRVPVSGRPVTTTEIGQGSGGANEGHIVAWSKEALEFVESSSLALPFGEQWLVRLPKTLSDPGTVSYGMTLLNELYGDHGDQLYNETWVHENAHLAWAIAVPELEGTHTRMFTEGLATLTQIEFTQRRYPDEPRDEYLARRYQNIRLNWASAGTLEGLPPIFTSEKTARDTLYGDALEFTGWAYEKSAITFDHLRAVVGDAAFVRAQKKYAETYQFQGGTLDQFRTLLEQESGIDLASTFDRWVKGTERPQIRVGFTDASIVLQKDDDRPIPLTLWLTTADGTRTELPVVAKGLTTEVPAPLAAFSVRPNPRQGVLAQLRSTVQGDVDFDGTADGLDFLACAPHFGETFDHVDSPGLWLADVYFPAECDRNDDGTLDDDDLAELAAGFVGGTK